MKKNSSNSKIGPKKIERPSLPPEEYQVLQETFNLFDTNHSGKIDPKQFKQVLKNLGLETKNPFVFAMISQIDTSGQPITFDEFVDHVTGKFGSRETKDGINRIFDLFDDDHTGSINLNNIKRIAKELDEPLSLQELQGMLRRSSSNNKQITREDFYAIITKKAF